MTDAKITRLCAASEQIDFVQQHASQPRHRSALTKMFRLLVAAAALITTHADETVTLKRDAPPAEEPVPDEQYASQLRQLNDMGFGDNAANLRALTQTMGNVDAAVERLLSGPQ